MLSRNIHAAGLFLLLVSLCSPDISAQFGAEYRAFKNPERVRIRGYSDHSMEPFLSRDGKYLFFNNSNAPDVNTEIHFSERIDDLNFRYKGKLKGANSDKLEGVPTMDSNGRFYFVSVRSYFQNFMTIYTGRFSGEELLRPRTVPGVSKLKLGHLNFDVEVSADGNTLYFADGIFSGKPHPDKADLAIAVRKGSVFERLKNSSKILKNINTKTLEYAPAISQNELELFFTRLMVPGKIGIFRAVRRSKNEPFGPPRWISAITGFIEAPTLSPDERSLYYHKKENGKFVIYRVTR